MGIVAVVAGEYGHGIALGLASGFPGVEIAVSPPVHSCILASQARRQAYQQRRRAVLGLEGRVSGGIAAEFC
jgi:hypothetical protein